MKILQIVYSGLGGNSSVAFSIVEGQKKNKKCKNFFLFSGVEKLLDDHKKKCIKLNISYIFVKKKRFQVKIKKILDIIFNESPDVIIVHDYNILPFLIYKFIRKKKLIYVAHGPDKTRRFIDWIIYFFNSIFSCKIVLVSKRKKNELMYKINKFFFSKKINVIENGINTKRFKK